MVDKGDAGYLATLFENCLLEKTFWYGMDEDPKEYIVAAGVPQGSVLCLLLWNAMYNGVLVIPVLEKARIVGFAWLWLVQQSTNRI